MGFKIVLFNIADFFSESRFHSLGLGYIASYLRKFSDVKDIYLIEGNGMAKLKKIKPDVIGIYTVTQTFNDAQKLAVLIKEEYRDIPIIVGGYHITALPHVLPKCFDIGVLGEGEETMKELMELIATFGLNRDKLANVRGIVFRDGSIVKITQPRGFIKDIDDIPFPARDLTVQKPFSSMITSRGCPYKCVFCASVDFWGKVRFNSAGYVIDELQEMIYKYKAIHISIWDDLFIGDRKRFETVCDLIEKKRINKKVSFGCSLRSNLVNEELCKLLKKINVTRVSIGYETGSQRILDYLKCGSVTLKQHIQATKLCKAFGFYTTGTFMLGNPDETQEDLMQTLSLVRQLKLDGGGIFTLATPLPGTRLWDYAKQKNLINDDSDCSRVGLMSADFSDPKSFNGILLTDKISKEAFFKIAQAIQHESNRYYIWGLFHRSNFSIRNIRFIFARPGEVIAILKFIFRTILRKASVMDRYVYYYKKLDS